MFIDEEAVCRLHPIGVPCFGLVSQQNMAHLRSASGSGVVIYKHCTPTECPFTELPLGISKER